MLQQLTVEQKEYLEWTLELSADQRSLLWREGLTRERTDHVNAEAKKNGQKIGLVDRHLVGLLRQRTNLVLHIEAMKRQLGDDIVNIEKEEDRLKAVAQLATERGLNPQFVQAVLYLIIDESCKIQREQRYHVPLEPEEPVGSEERYERLKINLLRLTELVAPMYDSFYRGNYHGLAAYLAYEQETIHRYAAKVDKTGVAIDLGTADGWMARLCLWEGFSNVVGYDISPDMIAHARDLSGGIIGLRFEKADVERGIPLDDGVATLVIMNEGTAGDVRNIEHVIEETRRVLRPGGRALFSFYNREALLYRQPCYPYETSLAAGINLDRQCLDVCAPTGRIFQIHAKPYTVEEVKRLFGEGLDLVEVSTYPTTIAIQANDLFEVSHGVPAELVAIDREMSTMNYGAYIVAVAKRR